MREFHPGFRINYIDTVFIIIIGIIAGYVYCGDKYLGIILAIPVVQFFMFCNVFRINRRKEIIWTAIFVLLAGLGYYYEINIAIISTVAFVVGFMLIGIHMKNKEYHGIMWHKINPNLRKWWESNG